MSHELYEVEPKFWTEEDARQAEQLGWTFEALHTMSPSNPNTYVTRHIGYVLAWIDCAITAHTWNDDPAKHIAEEAAKGSSLHTKAWLIYCKLELEGRIVPFSKNETGELV